MTRRAFSGCRSASDSDPPTSSNMPNISSHSQPSPIFPLNRVARLGISRNLCSLRNFFWPAVSWTPSNFMTPLTFAALSTVVAESFRAGVTSRVFRGGNSAKAESVTGGRVRTGTSAAAPGPTWPAVVRITVRIMRSSLAERDGGQAFMGLPPVKLSGGVPGPTEENGEKSRNLKVIWVAAGFSLRCTG